jgi:hypothetical protein
MIISTNQQLYAAVKSTSVSLENQNLKEEADELKEAMSISTLPGEILGEIRLVFRKIKRRAKLSAELNLEISNEINYIDSVLK